MQMPALYVNKYQKKAGPDIIQSEPAFWRIYIIRCKGKHVTLYTVRVAMMTDGLSLRCTCFRE